MPRPLVLVLVLVLGCSGGSSTSTSTSTTQAAPTVDFAQLRSDYEARRAAYLRATVAAANAGGGEGVSTTIARLELQAGPVTRSAIEYSLDQMDRRVDTADFGANQILRLLYLHAGDPLVPADLWQHIHDSVVGWKYGVDEPGTDTMVYWSENHQNLFATAEYLAGNLYPGETFANANMTGAQHAAKGRARILRWLDARERRGFSEWTSPVYYEEDLAPLLELVDFAPDADVAAHAAMVTDLLLFDLARLTNQGSFGVTAGRAYEEHKFTGRNQAVGDAIDMLWGTRGLPTGANGFCGVALATSRRYRPPSALLGIGRDRPARSVDRSRVSLSFADAPAAGIGFTTFDDGLAWWGMGAYFPKETIVLSRRMIAAWSLWGSPTFAPFGPLQSIPDSLLPAVSDQLSPLTEGSVLSTANTTTFRTPDAMLSSVEDFRKGEVGYQQSAWQATLGMDAVVWTTSPGTNGRDGPGPWTGSGSLPRVVQVGPVLAALYNPGIGQKALFPRLTHAFFPLAAFDETAASGGWTFARKGDGYVGLYSALATTWTASGAFAGRELVATGDRNVWLCVVGRRAEDGAFADFAARLAGASVAVDGAGNQDQTVPLSVRFEAPGTGTLAIAWEGAPTLDGQPIATDGFARFDGPYARAAWGARQVEVDFAGAALRHDYDAGTRTGDGL